MRLVPKLYVSAGILLAIALLSVAIAIWSGREAAFHLERTRLAHGVFESYLELSSNTYQLLRQYGEAMLIGDATGPADEATLREAITADVAAIRDLTAREIRLVGEEEFEELDRLAAIESQIESLLRVYADRLSTIEATGRITDPERFFDNSVDRAFNELIQAALAGEAAEVQETTAETASKIRLFNIVAAVFGVLAVAATGLGLLLLVRDIREPIQKLLLGARAIAKGNLDHRIEAGGRSELEDVSKAFNLMAQEVAMREKALSESNLRLEQAVGDRTAELERAFDSLKANEENRRRLLADVSHELRTPLTIIQGEAQIALRGGDRPAEEYREALARSRDAATHTASLVDDLLFVARREADDTRLTLEQVDLRDLLPLVIEENHRLAEGHGNVISLAIDVDEAVVRADRDRISQVVVILLDNAIRHGGSRIGVRLNRAPSGYAITVSGDGPGMTDEEQASAFERFYRGSNAAERYEKGTGLGLPVAKAIVEAHGGQIGLKSAAGEGVTASFTVPTRPPLKAVS